MRRLSAFLSACPVLALVLLSTSTSVYVGCGGSVSDGTGEETEYYGYSPYGYSPLPGCLPATDAVIFTTNESPPPTCTAFCASMNLKCNPRGFTELTSEEIPVYPYPTTTTCHAAGRRVHYGCSTECQDGDAFDGCDGGGDQWSTVSYKSGPYQYTACACSTE